MATHTHDLPLAFWQNNLEELDGEIARLATLCKVAILEPGAIQRVLHNDASVGGYRQSRRLRQAALLLMMHFAIREKSVDVFGEAATARVEDYVIERLKQRFGQLGD